MSDRLAHCRITNKILADVFFPKGTIVRSVLPPNPAYHPETFDVVIEHPDFDEVIGGNMLPEINVLCRQEGDMIVAKEFTK